MRGFASSYVTHSVFRQLRLVLFDCEFSCNICWWAFVFIFEQVYWQSQSWVCLGFGKFKDKNLQNGPAASVMHALELASGKRIEKLLLWFGNRLVVFFVLINFKLILVLYNNYYNSINNYTGEKSIDPKGNWEQFNSQSRSCQPFLSMTIDDNCHKQGRQWVNAPAKSACDSSTALTRLRNQ